MIYEVITSLSLYGGASTVTTVNLIQELQWLCMRVHRHLRTNRLVCVACATFD
jgi:hypothetical protein